MTLDNNIFKEISESISDKKLAKTAATLEKGFKPGVASKLQSAMELAYDLYFAGFETEAEKICLLLAQEPFKENFNLWTWINAGILLLCRIYETGGESAKVEEFAEKSTRIYKLEWKNEIANISKLNVLKRRLSGSLLVYDCIERAIAEQDKKNELAYRKSQFRELLFIYFHGGSEEMPKDKLIKEIEENYNICKN